MILKFEDVVGDDGPLKVSVTVRDVFIRVCAVSLHYFHNEIAITQSLESQ